MKTDSTRIVQRFLLFPLLLFPLLLFPTGGQIPHSDVCPPVSAAHSADLQGTAPNLGDVMDPRDLDGSAPSTAAAGLAPVTIPVWVHVITNGLQGQVTDAAIAKQVEIMNDSFAGQFGGAASPFGFSLAGTDRTDNATWFEMSAGSSQEVAAKTALRKGDAKTLNIYTADSHFIEPDGDKVRVSYGTFPWSYKSDPIRDGVVLNVSHMPPGGVAVNPGDPSLVGNLSLGDVAVHETGHWLGLYHTFQGYREDEADTQIASGCDGSGDFVSDTPAEDRPALCQPGLDTCPSEGQDPIHNFMDYTGDVCKTEFTQGQVSRMEEQWTAYRAVVKGRSGRGGRR